jgi:outer membrane lipoprotein SlyB
MAVASATPVPRFSGCATTAVGGKMVKLAGIEFLVFLCDDGDHLVTVEQRANAAACLGQQSLVSEHSTKLFGTRVASLVVRA